MLAVLLHGAGLSRQRLRDTAEPLLSVAFSCAASAIDSAAGSSASPVNSRTRFKADCGNWLIARVQCGAAITTVQAAITTVIGTDIH